MDVRAIREELRTAVTGLGYRGYDTLPEQAQLPCAVVRWPDEIVYDTTLGGVHVLELTVTVAVALGNSFEQAQRQIDEAMSWPGFGSALQNHSPVGTSPWRSLQCTAADSVRQINVGAEALACDFHITITAK